MYRNLVNKGYDDERIEYFNENRKLHREDGPAIEYKKNYYFWFLDGIQYNEEDYKKEMYKRNLEKLNV